MHEELQNKQEYIKPWIHTQIHGYAINTNNIHRQIHTYIHTWLRKHLHTYIDKYVHTYNHTYKLQEVISTFKYIYIQKAPFNAYITNGKTAPHK